VLATVLSATLQGLEGRVVRVEVDVASGLPSFTIVGLPDAALAEARERVRGAIRNSGFEFPPRRLTANLAPADVPKAGAALDLPIAIGILLASGQIRAAERWAFVGELSLGGEIHRVRGTLPMVAALARHGARRIVVAAEAADEGRLVPGVTIVPAATLGEAAALVDGRRRRRAPADRVDLVPAPPAPASVGTGEAEVPDLADVRGQLEARRALEIALAGGHALLLVGPPGAGKTLLARTVPGLLPPLGPEEALAATIVESVASDGPVRRLLTRRPFRAPHHTSSYAAIVGGGKGLSPGEVTRASEGVLFLDELAEFGRAVLEALREPLEEGRITIGRAGRSATFPARFQLIAATNPCPCGWAGTETPGCSCRPGLPERYLARISGPLRDRIDLWVEMPAVRPAELLLGGPPEDSATVAGRIAAARSRQLGARGVLNGRLAGRALRAACRLDQAARERIVELAVLEGASARGVERLLRVARTIADLAGSERVTADHLEEAARFRGRTRRPSLAAVV
jgi:magnesium chelatase family protein